MTWLVPSGWPSACQGGGYAVTPVSAVVPVRPRARVRWAYLSGTSVGVPLVRVCFLKYAGAVTRM